MHLPLTSPGGTLYGLGIPGASSLDMTEDIVFIVSKVRTLQLGDGAAAGIGMGAGNQTDLHVGTESPLPTAPCHISTFFVVGVCLFVLGDRTPLCSPGWPGTHCLVLSLTEIPCLRSGKGMHHRAQLPWGFLKLI